MAEHQATGTFDVTLTPASAPDAPVGRMALSKVFHGDLAATSVGDMLSFRAPVPGSAGYVAMERVTGTLDGRAGAFALQHSGTMTRGAPTLSVTVVPDSGTGALEGQRGRMTIESVDGQHRYGFRYELPEG